MTSIVDVTAFVTQTLKNSAEYEAKCIEIVGESLSFYDSIPIEYDYIEDKPYLTVTSGEDSTDELSTELTDIYQVIIQIGIEPTRDDDDGYEYTESDDIRTYTDKNKVHKLLDYAYFYLKKKSWSCGINSEDIKVISKESIVSEIGEVTEEVQGLMTVTFGKQQTLTEEW